MLDLDRRSAGFDAGRRTDAGSLRRNRPAPRRGSMPRRNGPTGFVPHQRDSTPYQPGSRLRHGFDAPPTVTRATARIRGSSPRGGLAVSGYGGGAPFGDLLGDRPGDAGQPGRGSARPFGTAVRSAAHRRARRGDSTTGPARPGGPRSRVAGHAPAEPVSSGTAARPTEAAPDGPRRPIRRVQARRGGQCEPAPTPQQRNGRVLLMALTAADYCSPSTRRPGSRRGRRAGVQPGGRRVRQAVR